MRLDKLTRELTGEQAIGQYPFVYEAKVTKRSVDDLHFVLVDEGETQEFGPAVYNRPGNLTVGGGGHSQYTGSGEHEHVIDQTPTNLPPKGTRLAVAFAGGDPDRPLVLAMYGWP